MSSLRSFPFRPLRWEVAVMPRAVVDGDHVRLTGVRNFDYRTRNDFTVSYEEREVLLSHPSGDSCAHISYSISTIMRMAPTIEVPKTASVVVDKASSPARLISGDRHD
jgi:hypothetical protein